jgi:hypothetical protein
MIKFLKNQLNKRYKKQLELTRVNPLSIIFMSWDQDNLMKTKQNKLWNLILNKLILKDEIERKKNRVNWVNQLNLGFVSWECDN